MVNGTPDGFARRRSFGCTPLLSSCAGSAAVARASFPPLRSHAACTIRHRVLNVSTVYKPFTLDSIRAKLASGSLMLRVPFFRPSIRQPEIDEVVSTLRSGWLTTGEKAKRFESAFAEYVNVRHAIAVTSCTAALHLSLEALGIGPGDGVLVPTMTFAATAEVVSYVGAIPILVDCLSGDLNIDPNDARKQILAARQRGQRVRAIMPVHYGGQICDMNSVLSLASEFDLVVIEDAAHCCPAYHRDGPEREWKAIGDKSSSACYSFYANKTITTGEGGMVTTNDDDLAHRMRLMSLHGISHDAWKRYTAEGSWYYEIVAPGFKYNLTDIAASLGLHQLARADEMHRERTRVARLYTQLLDGIPGVKLPVTSPDRVHSWHLYVVRVPAAQRDAAIIALKHRGIGTSVHWMPLHMHPLYRERFGYAERDLPVAATEFRGLISLPIYPDLSDEEVQWVAEQFKEVLLQTSQ